MPLSVPLQTILIVRGTGRGDRDGRQIMQRIRPQIGEPFDFTDEEHHELRTKHPHTIRHVVNEGRKAAQVGDTALPAGPLPVGDEDPATAGAAQSKPPRGRGRAATDADEDL